MWVGHEDPSAFDRDTRASLCGSRSRLHAPRTVSCPLETCLATQGPVVPCGFLASGSGQAGSGHWWLGTGGSRLGNADVPSCRMPVANPEHGWLVRCSLVDVPDLL